MKPIYSMDMMVSFKYIHDCCDKSWRWTVKRAKDFPDFSKRDFKNVHTAYVTLLYIPYLSIFGVTSKLCGFMLIWKQGHKNMILLYIEYNRMRIPCNDHMCIPFIQVTVWQWQSASAIDHVWLFVHCKLNIIHTER